MYLETKSGTNFCRQYSQKCPKLFVVDHETEVVLTTESPFRLAFKKFFGKNNLNEFVKKTEKFCANVEPKQINAGFHPVTQKEDTIHYVPTDSTLKAVLSHEDALTHIYTENTSKKGVF